MLPLLGEVMLSPDVSHQEAKKADGKISNAVGLLYGVVSNLNLNLNPDQALDEIQNSGRFRT